MRITLLLLQQNDLENRQRNIKTNKENSSVDVRIMTNERHQQITSKLYHFLLRLDNVVSNHVPVSYPCQIYGMLAVMVISVCFIKPPDTR